MATIGGTISTSQLCHLLRCHNQAELLHRYPSLAGVARNGDYWPLSEVKDTLALDSGWVERAFEAEPGNLPSDEEACDFEEARADDQESESDDEPDLIDRAEVERMLGEDFDRPTAREYLVQYAQSTSEGLRWEREVVEFYRRVHLGPDGYTPYSSP